MTDIMAFRVLTDKRRGLLPRAGRAAHDLAVRARALQGLHLDAQDQRLPLAPHHADLRKLDARGSADPHARDAPHQRIRPRRALGLQAGRPARRAGRLAARPDRDRRCQPRCRGTARAHPAGDLPGSHLRLHPQGRAVPAAQGRDARSISPSPSTPISARRRVGAKINGRHMPLRTPAAAMATWSRSSRASMPSRNCRGSASSSPARRAPSIRRAVRAKERDEIAEIGAKLFDEIAERLPAQDRQEGDQAGGRTAGTGGRGRPDVRHRRGQAVRPRSDGSAGPGQHRGPAGTNAAAGTRDLDQGA